MNRKVLGVAPKTRNHGGEELVGLQPVKVEGVARAISEQSQEGQLRATVAFPERMDGVQGRHKCCGLTRELIWRQVTEARLAFRLANKARISLPMYSG
nr:hypothetical protein [Phenylobacterium sp.]